MVRRAAGPWGAAMSRVRGVLAGTAACALLAAAGCDGIRPPRTAFEDKPATPAPSPASQPAVVAQPVAAAAGAFAPPDEASLGDDAFSDLVRRGRDIFLDTKRHAAEYVGNGLACGNCHLDAGRLADSAPLWGAYGRYPQFRRKTGEVNNYTERLQGCFLYSMNGTAPPAGGPVLKALEAYSFWMAAKAPLGVTLPGAGYPKGQRPSQPPDYARGRTVYETSCALCHGSDGLGQQVDGRYVFPPLWGGDSYNWGAGMHQLDNAAAFIRANMPYGRGGTLSVQDAWDVAMYINAQERPQDPRYTGNLAETRKEFHDSPDSLYGLTVDGRLLGANPSR